MPPKIFLVAYALVKNLLGTRQSMFAGTLTIGFLLVLFTLIAPFIAFRMCIHIYLMIAYGKLYGGLLSGADTIFEVHENRIVAHFLVIYTCNSDESKRIQLLREYINNIHKSNYKLSSRIKSTCGYLYFVKDQIKADEILEVASFANDEVITKSMVYEYIENHSSLDETNSCWKLTAFSQPVCWKEKNVQRNQYAAIISIRHSLADGPAMISLLKQYVHVKNENPKNLKSNFMKQSSDINLNSACLYRNPLFRMGGQLLKIKGNTRIFVTAYTEEKSKLVSAIKAIRKELNVKFVDVLIAAFSSSVRDYIAQRKLEATSIITDVTMRIEDSCTDDIVNGAYSFKRLENNFITATYDIPFVFDDPSMKNQITGVYKMNNIMKSKSVDHWAQQCFLDLLIYLPSGMIKFLYRIFISGAAIVFTNLVGFHKSNYCDGVIDEIFPFVTNLFMGFTFIIFTYDNRLGIAAASGRGCVQSREELETIVNGAVKYLHAAEKEILTHNSVENSLL